jgi:hypothetical protein
MPVHYVVVKGPEWERVAAQLAVEEKQIPKNLRHQVRRNAESLAERAKQKVRRLPVRGRAGTTGLRQRVAAGVHVVDVVNGSRISTSMAERDESIIPRGLDRKVGWRHPVYGNREVWVQQRPYVSGWFTDTIADGHDEIEHDLDEVLNDAAERIAARGDQRGVPGV